MGTTRGISPSRRQFYARYAIEAGEYLLSNLWSDIVCDSNGLERTFIRVLSITSPASCVEVVHATLPEEGISTSSGPNLMPLATRRAYVLEQSCISPWATRNEH